MDNLRELSAKLVPVRLKTIAHQLLKRKGIVGFILKIKPNAKLLDVGCGNLSPLKCKRMRPDIQYIGLDVGDYNQISLSISAADEYVLADSENFSQAIEKYEEQLDAVISSHNLEHCDKPEDTLRAMAKALKPGGKMFLAFPCENSVNFLSRRGTLNFYDDKTHKITPRFKEVCSAINSLGLEIDFAAQHYRPPALFLLAQVHQHSDTKSQ